jgi:4-hydroxybenzoate polyprenyltransferase
MAFAALLAGSSCLYVAGMYLNDYCDAGFDAAHRADRPIPSGQIDRTSVLRIAIGLLVAGFALVAWLGEESLFFALLLVGLIIAYNLVHKRTVLGVPLMAGCRMGLYLLAGSAAADGLSDAAVWAGILVFGYVLGVTELARTESTTNRISRIGIGSIAVALLLTAGTGIGGAYGWACILPLFVVAAWIAYAFRRADSGGKLIVGKTIGPLLAGICLVDWAVLSTMHAFSIASLVAFLAFFIMALIAQRRIPAS